MILSGAAAPGSRLIQNRLAPCLCPGLGTAIFELDGAGWPAYLAFTIGMTFQVSDTDLQNKALRRTCLHQAWISFPLGAVIIAASINLIAGLAK